MTNPFNIAGAQTRPSKKAPLYQGARWTSGLWTNRAPIRDAASTRLEEKFYGPRGDAFLGGENIEISQGLTLIRRPGNSIWNDNNWTNVNSFYEFRLFNSNIEQIKTMVDTTHVLHDASNNGQIDIWKKASGAGQSYMQSIGNSLYWGDGKSQKKWLNTLQERIPYVESPIFLPQNPYNFTPFELDTFVVDTNGNAEQLIATVLQLQDFYILDNTIVFTLQTDNSGILLPQVWEVLEPGLEIYFPATSQVAQVLGAVNGITLTVQNLSGTVTSASVYVGGAGYAINDVVELDQTSPAGSRGGKVRVTAVGNATGSNYVTGSNISTATSGNGAGAIINIVASGGELVSASVVNGGIDYNTGDYVYPIQGNGIGGAFIVTSQTTGVITGLSLATGAAISLSVVTAGSGYVTANNVPVTGGSGLGLTVNITDDETTFSCNVIYGGGQVTSFSIADPGSDYLVGDLLVPQQVSQPFATGLELVVTGIQGDPDLLTFVSGGPTVVAYTTGATTYTTSGLGTGASFTISSVSGGLVTGVTVSGGGTGFAVNDLIYLNRGSATGAILSVSTLSGSAIATVAIVRGGYISYTTATGVATTSSGVGTGLTIDITTVTSGAITSTGWNINAAGTGYAIGDSIYINQSGATGATFTVTSLTGSLASTIEVDNGGINYRLSTFGPGGYNPVFATTTSGGGSGATIAITSINQSSFNYGAIESAVVVSGGTGYAIGDLLYPSSAGGTGADLIITGTSPNGGAISRLAFAGTEVTGLLPTVGGSGYAVSGPYDTTTSGNGINLTVNITAIGGGGSILSVDISNIGIGYEPGDLIYLVGAGGTGAILTVTSIAFEAQGTGYVTGNNLPVTGGSGTGAEVNIVVDNGAFYPLTTATDVPDVYSGGNPISDSRANAEVVWGNIGQTTVDGSALWINRGPVVDNGLVYNWGIPGGTSAPDVVVNSAVSGWAANTYYNYWQFIVVKVSTSYYIMRLITPGKSGSSEPTWNTTVGQNTTDGLAVWQCLSNDGDTTLTWASETQYTPGHVLEDTVSSVKCVYQLQSYSGIQTQGSDFPVYLWQCHGQSGTDVGAAGQIPSGGGNAPMAQNGGQTLTTATYSGTMNSLFLTASENTAIEVSPIAGDGTVTNTPAILFLAVQNLSLVLQPTFIIPAAGIYTFQIGHQNAMFWGIGNGKIDLEIVNVSQQGGLLTIRCNQQVQNLLSPGVDLTFANVQNATWLNGQTVTVQSANGDTFSAAYNHSDYGPKVDTGTASSGNTLAPTVISGPMVWILPGSMPNVYNFSTGTPVSGYPIMSANYPPQGYNLVVDTVQIEFPAAGVYPAEIYDGHWYHNVGGYSTPTTSPALPGTTFSFYMIYQKPEDSIWYNIIPEGLACSSAMTPTFPAWPASIADIQAITPDYPNVTETSGNFTWWNLGPATTFAWNASVNMSTETFIVDPNSNKELPYEAGVSGTSQPDFSLALYGVVGDLPNLVWMNDGPIGNTPSGELSTTQGGWKYAVALVNTLDDTVSNASLVSISTGNFFSATGVFISGGLPASPDPQADYVAIFRTDDGGATYYLIPPPISGNGNTEYTLPLVEYLQRGFTDTNPDSNLNILLQAPLALQNSVPPVGVINLAYQDGRIFASRNNTVYWSAGPDTPIGNGYNGFPPNNYAEFPSSVSKIVPLNVGIFVFTVSDIYVISGNGTAGDPFSAQPFEQRVGLLSYNALTVNGSILYFMTTDQQVMELNVHSGLSQVGFPIADQFMTSPWSPANSYLTWHVNGSNDQCLFVGDNSTGWYRMSPTAPPENGTLTWSLKANIQGGCGAIQSVETSPGKIQLLLAPPPGVTGPILVRDYTTNSDNGSSYLANFVLGSLVLAHPGQLAQISFITTECQRVPGSLPISLGIRVGEIEGIFEPLDYFTNDPPQLFPSETLRAQRFYLSQTKQSAECRHCQIYGQFEETNSSDQLFTLTLVGSYMNEL